MEPSRPARSARGRFFSTLLVELDEAQWLDAEPYHDRLAWTQKWPREHWTLAYQGNLREIPEADFELLLADLQEAARTAPAKA